MKIKRVHIHKRIGLVLLLLAGMNVLLAQTQGELKTSIDSTRLEVGNQTTYHMEITINKGANVFWPLYEQGIHPSVEVLSYETDTTELGTDWTLHREMVLMPFDTGMHTLPPTFVITQFGNQVDTIISEMHKLEVYTALIDTTNTFKPIKPIKEEPLTLEEVLPIALMSYLGLSALLILIWFVRKLVKREPIIAPVIKPQTPPHTEAIRALNKLKKKKLWESGEYKIYYTELTTIIRNFIDRQMDIPALEQTSDEILSSLEKEKLSPQLFEGMKNLFRTADFVKFAKLQPSDDDNEIFLKAAFRFVDEVYQTYNVEQENEQDK